jgi:hypothetical protein
LLAHGRWFSPGTPGTPGSSTTKTGRHDIAEILLKVALKTSKIKNQSYITKMYVLKCNCQSLFPISCSSVVETIENPRYFNNHLTN